MSAVRLSALGICCALGNSKAEVWLAAVNNSQQGMVNRDNLLTDNRSVMVGQVAEDLPSLRQWPAIFHSRNNQLALVALEQLSEEIEAAKAKYAPDRIAVVIGTSTSGIAEGEAALKYQAEHGRWPEGYSYAKQEMVAPADFIAHWSGVTGPCYAISTACSSSARALISARTLLAAGVADAVIVGGVDSLCQLTLNGFSALESLSDGLCLPFSSNRSGINIGEGAALFLMEKACDGIQLLGAGAASDAHHMSAPHPEGLGAEIAIRKACQQANISAEQLDYINLHGTATVLNDLMEAKVLHRLGAANVPASSTKALTGHTLGAAGAIEAALCWLTLSELNTDHSLIPHCSDGQRDPDLASLNFIVKGMNKNSRYCLSNSFAFGGNNVALILGKSL